MQTFNSCCGNAKSDVIYLCCSPWIYYYHSSK